MTRRAGSQREAWTPLGVSWWSWRPLRDRSACARLLWLALYSSAPARRCPPGLWQGGPGAMGEEARLAPAEVEAALAELVAHELVEYDPETRVARLCQLPDQLDRPANGHGVRAWWSRFRALPACSVRDRHVATLRQLLGQATEHHLEAWAEGFGALERVLRTNGSRNGVANGSPNGSGNGSQPADDGQAWNGSVNGSPNRWGEGEGEGSGSSSDRSRSTAHSSRETPSVQDPVAQAASAAMAAWERRTGGVAAPVAGLAEAGLRRYGPRSVAQEGPSVGSGRYR